MKRITGYALFAIAAALTVGVVLQREASAQRAPQPPPERRFPQPSNLPRWEYATLRYDLNSDRWIWTTPDDMKRGDKRRLYKEMDGYGKAGDREINYVDLATQAGLYGWEMTIVLERERGTEIWFKRPLR
jgi:hypothetical protein